MFPSLIPLLLLLSGKEITKFTVNLVGESYEMLQFWAMLAQFGSSGGHKIENGWN